MAYEKTDFCQMCLVHGDELFPQRGIYVCRDCLEKMKVATERLKEPQKLFEEFEEVAQKGKKPFRILIPITKIWLWWKGSKKT